MRHDGACRKTRVCRLAINACRQKRKVVGKRTVCGVCVLVDGERSRGEIRARSVQMERIPPGCNLCGRGPKALAAARPARHVADVDVFIFLAVVDSNVIATRVRNRAPREIDRSRAVRVFYGRCRKRICLVNSIICHGINHAMVRRIRGDKRTASGSTERNAMIGTLIQHMKPPGKRARDVPYVVADAHVFFGDIRRMLGRSVVCDRAGTPVTVH